MARGIRIPLEARNGRLKLLYGDDYIDQLVRTAFLGSESDNPFQSLGMGEWMIFGINDAMSESEIKEHAVQIFKSFENDQLARLASSSDITFNREGEQLLMGIDYINMETQERPYLEVPIPPAGA